MKRIIVPTDFSDGAWNALLYATGLGEEFGVRDILVFNAYHAPYSGASTLVSIDKVMQRDSEDGLDRLMGKIMDSGISSKFNFHKRSIHSGLVDAVNSQINEYGEDLVVIGSLGVTGAVEKIFGSNASDVALKADCPVIVIPPKTSYSKYKYVVLGSDYIQIAQKNQDLLRSITNLDPDTTLEIVHVQEDDEEISDTSMGLKQKDIPHYVKEISGDNVSETLDQYVSDSNTDLLVIIKADTGFFERFFNRSITKKLTMLGHTPLLVLKRGE